MRFIDLFAGIGGFSLGLERAGMECVGQVEVDAYCRQLLEKHWPPIKRLCDIREVAGDEFGAVELVCGGFPCQPFSTAGKRRGFADDRYLWPEMLRVIQRARPRWVFGENVTGIVSMALDQVLSDLEGAGYSCQSFIVPACAVDALHRRDRVWIIGRAISDADSAGLPNRTEQHWGTSASIGAGISSAGGCSIVSDNISVGCGHWSVEPPVGRVADGVSGRVDRLKALGNAVVPQVVTEIGRAIMAAEMEFKNMVPDNILLPQMQEVAE